VDIHAGLGRLELITTTTKKCGSPQLKSPYGAFSNMDFAGGGGGGGGRIRQPHMQHQPGRIVVGEK
jgi:hypothetical protein